MLDHRKGMPRRCRIEIIPERMEEAAAAFAALRALIRDPQVHVAFHWKKSDLQHRDLKADVAYYTGLSEEEACRRVRLLCEKAPREAAGNAQHDGIQYARKRYARLVTKLFDALPRGGADLLAEEAWEKETNRRASKKQTLVAPPKNKNTETVSSFVTLSCEIRDLLFSGSADFGDGNAIKKRYKKILRALAELCGDHLRDRDFAEATRSPLWFTTKSTSDDPGTKDVFVCVYSP